MTKIKSMIAHRFEPNDLEFQGLTIPKAFVKFAMCNANWDYSPDADLSRIFSNALANLEPIEIIAVERFLNKLLVSNYSDQDLRKIFMVSGANIVFENPTQRACIEQILALAASRK